MIEHLENAVLLDSMSVETLNSLKHRAEKLTASEKLALAAYLREHAESEQRLNSSNPADIKRRERQAWISANRTRYGGLYVALDGDRLLGTGSNYAEALDAATNAGQPDAFVDFVPPENYVGESGGWD